MQCGTWTKYPEGGFFTSPNYPNKYPPDRECVYIIEGDQKKNLYILPSTVSKRISFILLYVNSRQSYGNKSFQDTRFRESLDFYLDITHKLAEMASMCNSVIKSTIYFRII